MKQLFLCLFLNFFFLVHGAMAGLTGQRLLVLPDENAQEIVVRTIQQSQTSIDLSLYHLDDLACIQALCDTALAGKKVRVLLTKPDLWPAPFDLKEAQAVIAQLKRNKVEVVFLRDFDYTLNHSKYMIVDGKDAWVYTFNFDPFNFGATRNFGVCLTDPSAVHTLQTIFNNDFEGKAERNDENIHQLRAQHIILGPRDQKEFFIGFLKAAEHSIHIYQQDLSDPDIGEILRHQVLAGKDVKILMSPHPFGGIDMNRINHTYIDNGERHVGFLPKKRCYIHAKVVILDAGKPGQKAYIGSCNFWPEALKRNRELGVILNDKESVTRLESVFESDWDRQYTFAAAKSIDDEIAASLSKTGKTS